MNLLRKLPLRRRPWTLRGRLIAALLALLAVVSAVIGIVSVTTVRNQVLGQVDRQLQAASVRSGNFGATPDNDHHGGGPPGFLGGPGQGAGTLGATRQDGTILGAGIVGSEGDTESLEAEDYGPLMTLPADGRPHTVTLEELGQYRVIATSDNDGDGTVLITGLPLKDANATSTNLTIVVIVVSLCGLLGAGVLGTLIVRFALRPLRRVADTATRVSKLPLDRGEVALSERVPDSDTDTRTEVGQVGAALNSLLGHVATALSARQASEMRVRQFVADASHELRTPLAAIRGYAEITRRTGEDVPEDITHAMNRVESEARRMTGLVEDLLLLARLDAGRPIDRRPVDLSALVINAASDAHAAGPQHPVRLTLPEEPIEIVGDPARLHQVLTNLLSNARVHTAPGTAISVTLRPPEAPAANGSAVREGVPAREVVVEVADEGPGIPPELLPHIFERFARADSSRSRTAGSTGLGLAIVAAVVAAHGGKVTVETRPGRTVFSVHLPVEASAAPVEPPGKPPASATPAASSRGLPTSGNQAGVL